MTDAQPQESKTPILDAIKRDLQEHVAVNLGRQPIAWAVSRATLDAVIAEIERSTGQPYRGKVLVRGTVLKVPGE